MQRARVKGCAEHRNLRRQVTRAIRQGRNVHWQRVDTRKLYQLVKQTCRDKTPSDTTLFKPSGEVTTSLGEQLKRWEEFFTEHLNHEPPLVSGDAPSASNPAPPYDCNVAVPTIGDLHSVVKRLKNHKSPGEDGIPLELLKGCSETLIPWLHRVISILWEKGRRTYVFTNFQNK